MVGFTVAQWFEKHTLLGFTSENTDKVVLGYLSVEKFFKLAACL